MSVITKKPLAEVNQEAIHILCQEIGVVDTVRFINQFTVGYGNYTEERKELFADLSLDDIVAAIKKRRAQPDTTC